MALTEGTHMFSQRRWAVALLVVLGATVPGEAADSDVTFASVVKSSLPGGIEGTPGGKLCDDRVAELVNNPDVRGDEAMAIASIHHFLRGKGAPKGGQNEKFLLDPKNAGGHEGRRDAGDQPARLPEAFRLLPHPPEVRPAHPVREGCPGAAPGGISQGQLCDCFVISAIGALATSPTPGSREVDDPRGEGRVPHRGVPGPSDQGPATRTDAQIVLGATAGKQGLWINVMEQAVAIDRKSKKLPPVVLDDLQGGGARSSRSRWC